MVEVMGNSVGIKSIGKKTLSSLSQIGCNFKTERRADSIFKSIKKSIAQVQKLTSKKIPIGHRFLERIQFAEKI